MMDVNLGQFFPVMLQEPSKLLQEAAAADIPTKLAEKAIAGRIIPAVTLTLR